MSATCSAFMSGSVALRCLIPNPGLTCLGLEPTVGYKGWDGSLQSSGAGLSAFVVELVVPGAGKSTMER